MSQSAHVESAFLVALQRIAPAACYSAHTRGPRQPAKTQSRSHFCASTSPGRQVGGVEPNIKNAHTRRRYCSMLIDFSLLINGSIKWHGLRGRARLHGAHMKERGARMSAHFPLFVQIVSRRGRRMRCLSARLNAVSVSRSFVVSVGVGACLRSARRREAILPWPLAFAWARAVRPVLSAAFTSMPG